MDFDRNYDNYDACRNYDRVVSAVTGFVSVLFAGGFCIPHRVILIGELVRPGYRDIPTGRLWPHMAQVSFLGPRPFVRESTGAI